MGWSCDRAGRAPRFSCGRDLRGRSRPVCRACTERSGRDKDAGGESASDRPGCARGHGSRWEVARILEPHVNRVVVVSPDDTRITSARAKTDKLDARTLASLLWKGELEAVWMPDERCRILRRRLARREQ